MINVTYFSVLQITAQSFKYKTKQQSVLKLKKLLGVHIDHKLKFDIHVETICKKAHRKFSTLSRIINCMKLPERRILMNAIFKAQFNYCPIIWKFRISKNF